MAESLIIYLLEQLASIALQEAKQKIKLVVGVDEEVRKMKDNLQTVKAVLNDAEKRQFTEADVKLWLKRLEDVSYEIDDVLDEWNTAMIKAGIEKKKEEEEEEAENNLLAKKVCSFIASLLCCFRQIDELVLRRDIASKIKDLNGELDAIVSEKGLYRFELTFRGNPSEVAERLLTTSLVDLSAIYGRDKVKVNLVNILLGRGCEEERSPHVISLVGMGGIGKTTLVQLAYNDPEVRAHFSISVWVHVSYFFDEFKVAKEIFESIEYQSPNTTTLQILLDRICDVVRGKRFFLVLDDVWSEDDKKWERLKNALKYGAKGSRILVTTRNKSVAEMMGSARESMINLEVLSDEDCWLVFSKFALRNRDPEQCKQLEVVGRRIANKCKGLPLAAKIRGMLVNFMSSTEWEEVLDSNFREFEFVARELFREFFLSYNDLPSQLKRCFSFCSIFPKDHKFFSDDLVFMWMAQGYIDSKKNMEIIGREYFKRLAICSFFQDVEKYEYDGGEIITCKMHDIVHEFAEFITKNECFTINSDTVSKPDYGSARYLRLTIPEIAEVPVVIYSAKNLRTLILDVPRDNDLSSLFEHFKCLRTLTLNFRHAMELPDAVGTFIHLRYLSLLNYDADRLPETICNLWNLQILKVTIPSAGSFKSLPQRMDKLINLRHLNFGRTY